MASSGSSGAGRRIVIRGARQHNLRDVTVSLPRDALVVVTGPSGSGKSSLAHDTLFAEGQRRYVESLSVHARYVLEKMPRPDVDGIDGLSPTVCVEQRPSSRNPRSTVGTMTEVWDFLRLLFSRLGRPLCPSCGRGVEAHTVQEMVDDVLAMPEGTRYAILAPVGRDGERSVREILGGLASDGFVRARIDGEMVDLSRGQGELPRSARAVDVYIDRLVVKPGTERRLADSLEAGLAVGGGVVEISALGCEDRTYSTHLACPRCRIDLPPMEPSSFSFNSPQGACPHCAGLGEVWTVSAALVAPDPGRSLREGAIAPWRRRAPGHLEAVLAALSDELGVDPDLPWEELPGEKRRLVLEGSPGEITYTFPAPGGERLVRRRFRGVIESLERRLADAERRRKEGGTGAEGDRLEGVMDEVRRFMVASPCPRCRGARLRPEVLSVVLGGRNIRQVAGMTASNLRAFLGELDLEPRERLIASRLLVELSSRLRFIEDVGLGYVTMDRPAATLSGGEAQRIRLASQLGSRLVGVVYVLDEPSIGLHPRDNERLIDTLGALRDAGNTVVVVEHDMDTIRAADHVVDMGPGAGVEGGRVVATGSPEEVASCEDSLTGGYLSGRLSIEVPRRRRRPGRLRITLEGARTHNLRDVRVSFPLGLLVAVTGVSGSGKSSLVVDSLLPAARASLGGGRPDDPQVGVLHDVHLLDRVVGIDQSPIGRTPRSCPATYTRLFGVVRDLFAALPEARARGYSSRRFSFNVKGGRCEACQGQGVVRIDMQFLPDVWVTCDVCGGRRFDRETLEVRFRERSIADVLDMSVREAVDLFASVPQALARLRTLDEVGLGYLSLGQRATTLSGGEAQRLKLGRELARRSRGRTLYVLDEPTTGLHAHDVANLLRVLERIVERGDTVIVIEHDLDVVKCADWVVDLGPEGGEHGGEVIAEGPPEALIRVGASHTGRFLAPLLGGAGGRGRA